MTGCADPDCKQEMKDLKEYTYGKTPGAGLMGKIDEVKGCADDAMDEAREKVPKSWLGTFVLTFGIAILMFIVIGYHTIQYASISAGNAKTTADESLRKTHELSEKNIRLEEKFLSVCTTLGEIKSDVKRLMRASGVKEEVKYSPPLTDD